MNDFNQTKESERSSYLGESSFFRRGIAEYLAVPAILFVFGLIYAFATGSKDPLGDAGQIANRQVPTQSSGTVETIPSGFSHDILTYNDIIGTWTDTEVTFQMTFQDDGCCLCTVFMEGGGDHVYTGQYKLSGSLLIFSLSMGEESYAGLAKISLDGEELVLENFQGTYPWEEREELRLANKR